MRQAILSCSLLPLLVGSGAVSAQEPVPGAKVEIVQLDVIVTDAQGHPVSNLGGDDFAIFEERKPQRPTNFITVSRAVPRATAAPPVATEVTPAVAPADAPPPLARHLVIVVDDLHIAAGNLEFARAALLRFIDQSLAPEDGVALVTTSAPGGVQQLSQDRASLKEAISRLNARTASMPPAPGSQMTPAQAELILRGDRSAVRLAGRMLLDEPGSVLSSPTSPRAATEEGSNAIASNATGPGTASTEALESVAQKEAERQARAVLNDALRYSVATLTTLADVLHSLAPLPGRKLCLLVSDGFLVGTGTPEQRTPELRAIVDAATRSGAVVYALDSRGLVSSVSEAAIAGAAAPPGLQASVDRQAAQLFRATLESLANDTGGFLVSGTNALVSGLGRMVADNDSYYLMAYEPTNKKRDGKFRRIEVKLPRHADYLVRTRRGYFAPDDRKEAAMPAGGVRTASLAAELDDATARAILTTVARDAGGSVRLTADYVDLPPVGPQALVRAHVDFSGLAFREEQGRHRATVDFVGGAFDANGTQLGAPFGHRAELNLTGAERDRAKREGLQFQQRLALPPGRYEIRLVAQDAKGSRLGGVSQWVEIPDLKDRKLALSSVFLSASAPTPGASAAGEGGESLRDVQTLRRFGRSDNLYFQIYVYNPSADEKGAIDVVLQAQIRSGNETIAASKPQAVTLQAKDGVPLPQTNGMGLEGLAPGRYDLRVVVVDRRAGATAFRQVDFTLE